MKTLSDSIRFNRIIFRDQVFTGEYLGRAVDECANHLDKNIRSNSPIVYCVAPNHIKTIIGFLAIVKTGRAALLVDPKVGKLEYEEMLADTMPSAIIRIDPQTLEFDFGKEIELTDYRMDAALVRELDDVAVMLYTAAEDGYAKAAMLTHRNMLSNAEAIVEDNCVESESTSCAVLPFHHIFGFQYGVITPLIGNGSIVISDPSAMQKPDRIAEVICDHKVSHLYSVPIIYYLLSKSPHIEAIGRQVYSLICGGYKMPFSLRKRFEQKLKIPIYEGYGLTETAAGCTWQYPRRQNESESVGRSVRNCKVEILDDSSKELPPGQKGEICVQGTSVTKGYFNRPEATRRAIRNGWLHTGDYGKLDKNGSLFFLGLKKKMFNVAGNKVYPEEVKRLMMKNSSIERVELFSTYNDLLGDKVHAKITLSDTSPAAGESFTEWCGENLTPYKIPGKTVFSGNELFEVPQSQCCFSTNR